MPRSLRVVGSLGWPGSGPAYCLRLDRGVIASIEPRQSRVADEVRADLVTAGFVDAHGHPALLGDQLAELDLSEASSYAEALDRIAHQSGTGWLLGSGWDQHRWSDAPEGGWPRAADLDRVAPVRPAVLTRVDRHAIWVNSIALQRAGISRRTEDPAGGWIVRDEHGEPAGVLVDRAAELIVPEPPSAGERRDRLARALAVLASEGLTGVHDMMADDATLRAYGSLQEAGELPIRVWAWAPAGSDAAEAVMVEGPRRGSRLSVVGVKAFADGALGSHGALLRAPYLDQPSHRGLALCTVQELAELARRCNRSGAILAVHCIGDLAVANTLDAFERAGAAAAGAVRFRIEHAQLAEPQDMERMARLGVVASMQPIHATSDMGWAESMLGARIANAYAWRSMLRAGVRLALGSDFPIEAPSPARGVWAAVTRTDASGWPPGGWMPEQRLGLHEAIDGFTRGAAVAAGEVPLGIRPGARADLSLWKVRGTPSEPRLWPLGAVVDGVLTGERAAIRR